MNRWPDGRRLTAADMEKMALDHNLIDPEKLANTKATMHSGAMFKSFLSTVTQQHRFEAMSRGELVLDTRTPTNTRNYKETT